MEETTESVESSEVAEVAEAPVETTETEIPDNAFDADYKDDFSVPTEADAEDVAEQKDEEYSDEDINDAMMDYLKDNFDMPDKFKDVESLISSYKHLEGKMGNLKGSPETYELDDSIFDNYSDDMLGSLTGIGREMGLDNDGMNKMLSVAAEMQTKEADANWEMEKHKLGAYADEELASAVQYLDANFAPDVASTLQGMVSTAAEFRALSQIIKGNSGSTPVSQAQVQQGVPSDSDIQKMLFSKDEFGNSRMETDSDFAAKVNRLMKANW